MKPFLSREETPSRSTLINKKDKINTGLSVKKRTSFLEHVLFF